MARVRGLARGVRPRLGAEETTARISDSFKILSDFVAFARQNRVYWIVPLVVMLGLAGILIVAGQAAAPLIYALF